MYSTAYGFIALFKAGAFWTVGEGFSLRARVARNFRQPTIREKYLPYPTANPDLKPETSINVDLGFGVEREHVEAAVTWYRTDAENMIRYFGAWPSAEVVNIDRMVVYGIEAHVGVVDVGPVSLSLNADWRDVGRYTRQNPSSKYNFVLGAGHAFGQHGIESRLSGEWVRGLFSSNYGRDPLDDVFFMDLTVRYRYTLTDRLVIIEPYLHLRNITNSTYAYIEGYVMPGFNLAGGVKVTI
jgi:outer membrane cobalamin receptor